MPLGIGNRIGCENPRLRLRFVPWTAALKPTPSISRFFEKPSLTPTTILYTRARDRPCNAFALRVSAPRASEMWLSLTLALICRGSFQFSLPFGPSTETSPSLSMLTLTLSGMSTGLFPIRDIKLTKHKRAARRPFFVSLLPGPTSHPGTSIKSPCPFRRAHAEFHQRQHNGADQDG